MNLKNSDPNQYRMSIYHNGVGAPAAYTLAMADKPGLYAASPYAASITSPFTTGQPGLSPAPAGVQYVRQQYAVVTQPTAFASPGQHPATAASFYTTPAVTGYATATPLPLAPFQSMGTSQSAFLGVGAQYPPVHAAMLRHASAAANYGGSPLFAYSPMPAHLAAQPNRAPYMSIGYAVSPAGIPPSAAGVAYPSPAPVLPSAYGVSPPY